MDNIEKARLVKSLVDAAIDHEWASGNPDMAVGDMEELLLAAFEVMADEQIVKFWQSARVRELLLEIPEYGSLSKDIYVRTYRATGTCEDGPFDIEVTAWSPADALVEVSLSTQGETSVASLIDESGRDVLDDIDPDDPSL